MEELYEVFLDKVKEKFGEPKKFEHKGHWNKHCRELVNYVWERNFEDVSFNIKEDLFLIKKKNTGVKIHFQINYDPNTSFYLKEEQSGITKPTLSLQCLVRKKGRGFILYNSVISDYEIKEYLSNVL